MRPESPNLQDYLAADDVVDWKHPEVLAKTQELVSGLVSDVEKSRRLFEWVRDEIPHSKDIDSDVVTCSASEVLRHRTGICYAKSHLLAALLRANGIPSGFCYQVLRHDPPLEGVVLHGLNGIYIESLEKWIRLDSRGNTNGINAQFGIDKEQLAFNMDAAAGEFIYDVIFALPARVVIETLKKYDSRSQMWPNLPENLSAKGYFQE